MKNTHICRHPWHDVLKCSFCGIIVFKYIRSMNQEFKNYHFRKIRMASYEYFEKQFKLQKHTICLIFLLDASQILHFAQQLKKQNWTLRAQDTIIIVFCIDSIKSSKYMYLSLFWWKNTPSAVSIICKTTHVDDFVTFSVFGGPDCANIVHTTRNLVFMIFRTSGANITLSPICSLMNFRECSGFSKKSIYADFDHNVHKCAKKCI